MPQLLELREAAHAAQDPSPMDTLSWGRPIPLPLLLNAMRGFMLGVPADDQQTLSALSRWKPWRGQWDPQNYTYGTFYLAGAGAALAVAKMSGALPGDLSVGNVLRSPDLAATFYRWVRGLSALFNGISAVLLYLLLRRDLPWWWAMWAAAIFLLSPLVVTLSHLAKPHALGCTLILGGLWLHQRRASPYAVMTLIGLSAACLVTNYLAAAALRHWKALLLGIAVSLAANYPIVLNGSAFVKNALTHHVGAYHQGMISGLETLTYLKHFLRYGFPGLLLPLTVWGLWRQAQNGDTTGRWMIGMGLLYAGVDLVWFRHHGVGLLPTAIFFAGAAYGLNALPYKTGAGVLAAGMLLLFFHDSVTGRTRFERSGQLTDAGAWMNSNIKPGSTIGIVAHNVTPATTPAFAFLNYRLALTPLDTASGQTPSTDYVVVAGRETIPDAWTKSFKPAHQWAASPSEENPFLMTHENVAISLWEKRNGR
jgi:hypothetical protein